MQVSRPADVNIQASRPADINKVKYIKNCFTYNLCILGLFLTFIKTTFGQKIFGGGGVT